MCEDIPNEDAEMRFRNLEAMILSLGCQVKVLTHLLVTHCQSSGATVNGKSVDVYFQERLKQELNQLLATIADSDPEKASWLAQYIKKMSSGNIL